MGKRKTTEEFIKESKNVHGEKYDYSKVEYKNWLTKVCIICPIHGEFWQFPQSHLNGIGCKKCSNLDKSKSMFMTNEDFIEKSKKVHGDKYIYSNVNYTGYYNKVSIICPKHGEFIQEARTHLNGHGCPSCKNSIMENDIAKILNKNGILFENRKKFKWLEKQHLDFYLPDYKIAIECQGEQHFISKEHFGGNDGLEVRKKLDKKKYDLCNENGVKLVYYSNNISRKKMFDNNIIHNELELIKIIT